MTELAVELDKSSPVPLYFQVARQIEAAIASGQLHPGAKLENEIGLADRLGLSRPTMRRAIQELVDKGLLVRKRGVGTQVVNGQVSRNVELSSLYDDLARLDQRPSTELLGMTTGPASDDVAATLVIPPRSPVVHLERLRRANGEPLAIMRNWLPVELTGALTPERLSTRGLYEVLRGTGLNMRIASQRIGARAATAAEARLLEVRRGAPLLTMERTTFDDSGRAVELGRHVYRSDTYSFELTVVER